MSAVGVRGLPGWISTFCQQSGGRLQLTLRTSGKPPVRVQNSPLFPPLSLVFGCKMSFYRVLSAVLVPVCWLFVSAVKDDVSVSAGTTAGNRPAVTNSSGLNSTQTVSRSYKSLFDVDSSMIQRALYVLIGITMIGVLYFLIRAVRLKKPGQRKKYGLLSNYDDSVEMEAVESDEDDTLYEARSLRR